jgi:uncharacterized membrane protein YhaH (DUF805 family)
MSHIANCFKKYATFSGRASRAEYWTFFLFLNIVGIILFWGAVFLSASSIIAASHSGSLDAASAHTDVFKNISAHFLYFAPSFIFFFAVLIPTIAVSVRRLHDAGFSGWMMALHLIGLGIVPFIMFFFASKPGDNEYGPNPYGQ